MGDTKWEKHVIAPINENITIRPINIQPKYINGHRANVCVSHAITESATEME